MGRKLQRFVGVIKDKASLTKATLVSPPSSSAADLAVLRATSHHHPSSPPHPHHIAALLSFGHGARPAAAALSSSLSSRLLSTRDPSVALKSLLSLHHLLRSAPFILLDSLFSSLLPKASGRHTRSPLLLSSFPLGPDPVSWSLSSCVRWYSRLLELRIILPNPSSDLADWVSSLLTRDLISELDTLTKFLAEAFSPPELPDGNRLLAEVMRVVNEDRITAENGIAIRLGEVRERIDPVGFGDAVELVFVLRRLEEHRPPSDARWMDDDGQRRFWTEVKEVREKVEEVVVRREKEERAVSRERGVSASDRFGVRTGEVVLFGSNRWVKQ
ncbi:putative clathrin assembly protein At4g40080 [Dendrobium catenatum]|uniref:Clathrin assembly protein n=1 Tax=Dendrobium catenatum TaxID=906689 RepID=A0A2I0W474_9ASPA|nr:putative clathrin assembly protein At4g40080 [Dendrobium catenatum]PKU70454.1 Putative clathrin assembly protein [Dendrobium catenatum]